jgi:hypothetical protein
MTAPLPRTVQVGPFRYGITTDPETLREIERREGTACYGGANHRTLTLAVDVTVPPDQQRDTLWHEVKHAISNLAAIGDGPLSEEQYVERSCSLELLVLRTNPALVAFLLEDDDAQREVDGADRESRADQDPKQAPRNGPGGVRARQPERGQGIDAGRAGQKQALGVPASSSVGDAPSFLGLPNARPVC